MVFSKKRKEIFYVRVLFIEVLKFDLLEILFFDIKVVLEEFFCLEERGCWNSIIGLVFIVFGFFFWECENWEYGFEVLVVFLVVIFGI